MFSLALSPIIALSLYSCVLKCKSSSPAVWQVMFLALISISEVKGRNDVFCPATVTVTYMLPVQDGTLLQGPPSLSGKLIMNQSVWNIYGCHPHPFTCVRPIRASSVAPAVWVRETPCTVISIFLCWSPAEASPAALSTHANLHSPACVGDGMLAASPPCSQTYCCLFLSVFFYFFFFSRGKGFLIPGMPEKGPLRITLAKPLSLQEIHCLLKKVVGVENQGEVLFFLSFSLFPWKVITGLKKSPFFGTQVFA